MTVWLIAAASAAVAAMLVLVTAAVTVNADAYDGARWRAGELAVKAGVRPSQVDAGFEWVGDHADEDAISTRHEAAAPLYETCMTRCSQVSRSAPSYQVRRGRGQG